MNIFLRLNAAQDCVNMAVEGVCSELHVSTTAKQAGRPHDVPTGISADNLWRPVFAMP